VMCESSLCVKHRSAWKGFANYDLATLSKITQNNKSTSNIRVQSGSKIPMKRNQG
jgi:hypothetical protein